MCQIGMNVFNLNANMLPLKWCLGICRVWGSLTHFKPSKGALQLIPEYGARTEAESKCGVS